MAKRHLFYFLATSFLIAGCGEASTREYSNPTSEVKDTTSTVELTSNYDGFQLLETTCFSCHSPNPNNENNVAPTIAEIKTGYLENFPNSESFNGAIQDFLKNPSAESALLKDAVEQYGLMPQMSLNTEQTQAIASYLFSNSIESGGWFKNSYPLEKERIAANKENLPYVDRGFEYAMATKSVLGKNLKGKINNEGTLAAVNFCNLNAVHFTDSMSLVYNAEIKRVSDKPRNENNAANDSELQIMDGFRTALENGEEITPVTVEEESHVLGYYPIVTNDMCLKCHGDPKNIEQETYSRIKDLYPNDKATGYTTNRLRGIWVVNMKR